MTENQNKIMCNNKSIEKNELFGKCNSERKIARVEMMMLIHNALGISVDEAHNITKQLKSERETFYQLND